jgi:hypothetical protein
MKNISPMKGTILHEIFWIADRSIADASVAVMGLLPGFPCVTIAVNYLLQSSICALSLPSVERVQ